MKERRPFIGFEIHDTTLWEPTRVLPMLETMQRWGYNALVLHENDLLDACTQLGLTANYGVSDLRLKKVRNRTAWMTRLASELDGFDARLFLEIKEPSYPDYAVELWPDLFGADGQPDPTRIDPWAKFLKDKTRDLLDRVPGIGGLIVTLASPESRVSLPDRLAETGKAVDAGAWFDAMIGAIWEPLREAGKILYIRDFSYTSDLQSHVLSAVDRLGGTVGASVKITAHDYFPEYPENPAARGVSAPMILEFEAFGEHTGWGVIPNCRVGELRQRMAGAREMGAGVLMRTSWEAVAGANALDGLSAVNVYALPRLLNEDVDDGALVAGWLSEEFGLAADLARQVARLMLDSWFIPAAAYWGGKVFPRHSCLPSTWSEGWLSMESDGMGRRDRQLDVSASHPLLSETARARLFADKDKAVALADQLAASAVRIGPSLPPGLRSQMSGFRLLPLFARQFALATKATFYAARGGAADLAELPVLAADLQALADELADALEAGTDLPTHARVLLDPGQVRRFVASLPIKLQA